MTLMGTIGKVEEAKIYCLPLHLRSKHRRRRIGC